MRDSHNTTIAKGYQAVLHVNSVRQTVRIVSLDHPKGVLRTGDRAKIIFEFIQGPEFIREGARLLFRENKTKVSPAFSFSFLTTQPDLRLAHRVLESSPRLTYELCEDLMQYSVVTSVMSISLRL